MKNFFKKLKKAILDSLDKIAKDSEKELGSGKLDCCNLNKKDVNPRR